MGASASASAGGLLRDASVHAVVSDLLRHIAKCKLEDKDLAYEPNVDVLPRLRRYRLKRTYYPDLGVFDEPFSLAADALSNSPMAAPLHAVALAIARRARGANNRVFAILKCISGWADTACACKAYIAAFFGGWHRTGPPRAWKKGQIIDDCKAWVTGAKPYDMGAPEFVSEEMDKTIRRWIPLTAVPERLSFAQYSEDPVRWATAGGAPVVDVGFGKKRSKWAWTVKELESDRSPYQYIKRPVAHAALKEEPNKMRLVITTPMDSYIRQSYLMYYFGVPELQSPLSDASLERRLSVWQYSGYVCLDAKNFDHQVPKRWIEHFFTTMLKYAGDNPDIRLVWEDELRSLAELRVEIFGQHFPYQGGELSGWRLTSVIGTMLTEILCKWISNGSTLGFIVQGDDILLYNGEELVEEEIQKRVTVSTGGTHIGLSTKSLSPDAKDTLAMKVDGLAPLATVESFPADSDLPLTPPSVQKSSPSTAATFIVGQTAVDMSAAVFSDPLNSAAALKGGDGEETSGQTTADDDGTTKTSPMHNVDSCSSTSRAAAADERRKALIERRPFEDDPDLHAAAASKSTASGQSSFGTPFGGAALFGRIGRKMLGRFSTRNSPGPAEDSLDFPPIFVRCIYDLAHLHKDDPAKPLLAPFTATGKSETPSHESAAAAVNRSRTTSSTSDLGGSRSSLSGAGEPGLARALLLSEHRPVSKSVVSQIVECIMAPNLHKPITLMINEHRKTAPPSRQTGTSPSTPLLPRHFSIYRDVFLLAIGYYGKHLRVDEFEKEYKSSFSKLPPKIAAMLPTKDKAPALNVRACSLPLDLRAFLWTLDEQS